MNHIQQKQTSTYKHLVNEINQALMICIIKYNPDGSVWVRRILETNPRFEKLLNLQNKAMIIYQFSRLLSRLSLANEKEFRDLMKFGTRKSFKYQYKKSKNDYINLKLNLSTPSKNIMVILIEDETELYKKEETIKNKQQLLQEAQSIGRISNWKINAKTREQIWSLEYYRILEYPESEKPDMDLFKQRIHPEDNDAVLHAIADAIEYRHNLNISFRLLVNNKIKFVRCSGKIETDENGNEFLAGTSQDVSPLFHSQLELEESEKKYRSLFDSIDSAALVLNLYTKINQDEKGNTTTIEKIRIVDANKTMERMSELSADRLINRDFDEVYPLTNIQNYISNIKKIIHNNENRQFVYMNSDKNKYILCNLFKPSWNSDNFCALLNDITEQVLTQKINLGNENRLRELLQHMPVMLIAYDKEEKILIWNRECERITGYLASEMVGKNNFFSLLLPNTEYRKYVLSMLKKLKKNYRNLEWDITSRNGTTRSIAWSNMSQQFTIPGWDSWEIGIDITETVKAINALRNSQKKSKTIIEAIPDIIFTLGNNGVFTSFNSPEGFLVDNFGTNVVGSRMEEIFPGELSILFYKKMRETIDSGEVQVFEFSFEEKLRVQHYEGRMLTCGENEIMALIRNMTDSKQLKEELNQAEKMQAIGQLAGGISHDFNNQLMGILSFADLLRERISDPEDLSYLDQIITGARRSADLTNQMLAFSRKGKYQEQAISIHSVIKELSVLLHHSLDKKINLKFQLDSPHSMIFGDISQLQNAMLNLCLNARDAMPNGGLLQIETSQLVIEPNDLENDEMELAPGDYVCINFIDTGVGIPEAVIDHIFEPFYTTKKAGEGTGMGLAAVFGTIKNHNGKIQVKSRAGHGSVFTILLPLTDAPEISSEVKQFELPIENTKNSGNIMVVDDEAIIREALSRILEKLGYSVICFGKGNKAIKYYRDNFRKTDLVLLDMIMPDNTGYELFELLKKINPSIKAAFLSGYTEGNSEDILETEGIEDFIKKPVNQKDLAKRIALILNKENTIDSHDRNYNEMKPDFSRETALQNMGGDTVLYEKMIMNFIHDTDLIENVLRDLFQKADKETLYLKCHNLKSLSGSIGAFGLMRTLEEYELKIKNRKLDENDLNNLIAKLKSQRFFLINERNKIKSDHSGTDGKTDGKPERLKLFLTDMKQPLEIHQPGKAQELLDIINSFGWSNHIQGKINSLQDAVNNYRFNSALDQIIELLEFLNE